MTVTEAVASGALVLAPTLRDARVTARILGEQGIASQACDEAAALQRALEAGVDVVVTTDDVSRRPDLLDPLTVSLRNQPGWSEIPVVVVAKDDRASLTSVRSIPGSIVLERPVQIRTFISTVQAALTARQRQYQIRDQLEEIRRANEELQRAATFAQQLMAIVSHDLRNPLAAIQNGTQLLLRSNDPSVQRIAPLLKRSAERANGLINDLLDFSQARMGGGIPTRRQPVNVNELLEDTIATMSRSDPDRVIGIAPCPVTTALWDYERIHQALVNLLVNALKHSPLKSTVGLSANATESDIIIEVSNLNKAEPIPVAIRQTLFEPFKRFATDGVNSRGSIGLGLYIVDQIAKGHDGRTEVESDEKSTRFRLILPRASTA